MEIEKQIQKKSIPVDEAYDSEPWWYDMRGLLILTFAYRSTLPNQIRLFEKNIGRRHLEIAIGSGSLFDLIWRLHKWKGRIETSVLGFDYAPSMLAGAKKRFRKEPKIELLQADAAQLELASNIFDSANIANAIHCLPDLPASLREIHRVLKPKGTLAGNCLLYPKGNSLLDRLANWINEWGRQKGILNRPYYANEIQQQLQEAGFRITYEKVAGNCYDFIAEKS